MDLTFLGDLLSGLLLAVPFLAVATLLLFAAWILLVFTTKMEFNRALLVDENPAVALLFGSFILAAAIAVSASFFGRASETFLYALGRMVVEGAVVIALLRLSIEINDRLILHRFSIAKEIRDDRNVGTAWCVAGSCLASGLVINGAMVGFSESFLQSIRDIVIYWLVGQAFFVLGAFLYSKLASFDVHQLIEYDDNVAVGLSFGAFLLSLGIVVRASLVGSGQRSIVEELLTTFVLATIGMALVLVSNVFIRQFLVPKSNFRDEVEMNGNLSVSMITSSATVAIAILLAMFLPR